MNLEQFVGKWWFALVVGSLFLRDVIPEAYKDYFEIVFNLLIAFWMIRSIFWIIKTIVEDILKIKILNLKIEKIQTYNLPLLSGIRNYFLVTMTFFLLAYISFIILMFDNYYQFLFWGAILALIPLFAMVFLKCPNCGQSFTSVLNSNFYQCQNCGISWAKESTTKPNLEG
jgi:uncharacterized membrane protein YqjE